MRFRTYSPLFIVTPKRTYDRWYPERVKDRFTIDYYTYYNNRRKIVYFWQIKGDKILLG